MLINSIKYFITLILGVFIGYFLFHSSSPQDEPTKANLIDNETVFHKTFPNSNSNSNSNSKNTKLHADNISQQNTLNKLNKIIEQQSKQINQLNQQLAQLEENAPNKNNNDKNQILETISLNALQDNMQEQFLTHYRNYAIELTPEMLESLQKTFQESQLGSDKSAEFENKINDYMSDANSNGIHFIEELNCGKDICRLKVQSNDLTDWRKIYANMAKQKWNRSMTFVEKSDNPNHLTYYIHIP